MYLALTVQPLVELHFQREAQNQPIRAQNSPHRAANEPQRGETSKVFLLFMRQPVVVLSMSRPMRSGLALDFSVFPFI